MAEDATRDLLAYYGIAEDADEVEAEVVGDETNASTKPKPPPPSSTRTKEERTDMNDVHFEAQLYVDGLLQKHGIRELKEHSKRITGHIRSLDSEMQMLVYQNYNKFISATDMIRQMKTNVEAMEEEMGNLVQAMNQISTCSSKIETKLAPNRGNLDNLVGVSKLLKRLKFLFELPGRLNKSIEMGAHAQAVRYFRVSNKILKQYAHIKSFEKIRIESEHIVHHLKVTLREIVKNPNTTADVQMENAGLLMELDSPPEHLLHDIFDGRKQKFISDIKKAASEASISPVNEKSGSSSSNKEDGEIKTSPSSATDLITLLERNFFQSFKLFASAFLDTFVHTKSNTPASKVCEEGLCDFTKEVFVECGNAVRDYLLKLASTVNVPSSSLKPPQGRNSASSTTTASAGEEKENDSDRINVSRSGLLAVNRLTTSMIDFHRAMSACDKIIPKAHLIDKTAEILEIALRSCMESIAESTQQHMSVIITNLYSELINNKQKLSSAPSAKLSAIAIREAIEGGIELLVPLLSMNAYEAESDVTGKTLRMASKDMAPSFLSQMIQHLVVLCSEEPQPKEKESLATLASSSLATTSPVFWLYLSHMMSSIENVQLIKLHKYLITQFPVEKKSRSSSHQNELDPEMLALVKNAATNLRISYVDCHGAICSSIIRAGLIKNDRETSRNESHVLKPLVNHLKTLCSELALMFPTLPPIKVENQLSIHLAGAQDDKNRLLRERIQVLGTVLDNPSSLTAAIFRLLVKSLSEHVRLTPRLTQAMYSQIQAEVAVLRALLGGMLASAGNNPGSKDVDSLLEELLSSASDRCIVEPTSLSAEELQSRKTALMHHAGI